MNISIVHNMQMMAESRHLKTNSRAEEKAAERLASGYRINRAADDAAGLSISEKMRLQIRALKQGTNNAMDGVSWVQIGDAALEDVHSILHRMNELAIASVNDTNTHADRAAMQDEFEQLQQEIDHITDNANFNTKHIFDDHEATYYQFEGNVKWDYRQAHKITDDNNDLLIKYREKKDGPAKEIQIKVNNGVYTTQELIDEIDDAMFASGLKKDGIYLEYTSEGFCNVNYEGGETIDAVTGGLSYLLYNMHGGGSLGALIGTTVFSTEDTPLDITNQNNKMTFTIEKTDGSSREVNITLNPGQSYSKTELMNELNKQLEAQLKDEGITVEATNYGKSIRLASQDCIISGLKGNMFKIDEGKDVYTSVFYDNIKYGTVKSQAASLTGGAVLAMRNSSSTQGIDPKYSVFRFDSSNDTLVFSPNGSKDPKELKFDHNRTYSLYDVQSTLAKFFADNNMALSVSATPQTSVYVGGSNGYVYFSGLKITSLESGIESDVGIDRAKSSAYDTLFVNQNYTSYGYKVNPTRDTTDDRDAYVCGTKTFSPSSLPLKIEAGKNDTFRLTVTTYSSGSYTPKAYDIRLDEAEYNTVADIVDALNDKLNGNSELKGKVEATENNGKIQLNGIDSSVYSLGVSRVPANTINLKDTGYYQIFIGENVTMQTTLSNGSTTMTTCNTKVLKDDGTVTIAAGETDFRVTLDNKEYKVTLDAKTYTQDELKQTINDQLKAGKSPENVEFTTTSNTGRACSFDFYAHGNTSYTKTDSYTGVGDSDPHQGEAGKYDNNVAAEVTLTSMRSLPTVIDDTNDKLTIKINGDKKELTLAHTTSANDIVKNIQSAIDDAYGTNGTGAIVSLKNGKLVFTARLTYTSGAQVNGAATSIDIAATGSSFMQALHRADTQGSFGTATYPNSMYVQNSFTIEKGKETFSLEYESNGVKETLTVTLNAGETYDPAKLRKAINDQHGTKIIAGGSGSNLQLTTVGAGSDKKIYFKSENNKNNATAAIFGAKEAKISLDKDIQNNIKITSSNNRFAITINGRRQNIYLDTNTSGYSRADFITQLNTKLSGKGVTAVANGNSIDLIADPYAGVSSIGMEYDKTSGSAMPAIFGQEDVPHEGLTADFNSEGQLTLTRTSPGGTVRVSSTYGSAFQKPTPLSSPVYPTPVAGHHSTQHAKIDGNNLAGPVKIDDWNNRLKFTLYEKNASNTYDPTSIDITLTNGTYSFDGLRQELQARLDEVAGGKLEAFVDKNGVVIQTKATGTAAHMGTSYSNFSGSFYDKVICGSTEITNKQKPNEVPGTYGQDAAYAVGRKDVKNHPVRIQKGVNDSLHLDLTAGSTAYPLDLTLDAGSYNSDALVKMLQKKLNEALVAKGLKENTILAGIGEKLSDIEIIGSNDANALSFRLNTNVKLPTDGEYVIDGISGTAAFSVFYYTEGDISIASVQGTVPISGGVTLKEGQTDLAFSVDGTEYTFDFEAKTYTSTELVDELNAQLKTQDAPIVAKLEDGALKLVHTKYGNHKISDFSGGAKQALLFRENYRARDPEKIHIQFSNLREDNLEIDKPYVNTLSLEVNSLAVTKAKYAEKAMLHIQVAIEKISAIRSYFGAMQNRLEKAVMGNENKTENTQASESKIRDAEMFDEVLKNSTNNILKQAVESIMAQSSSQQKDIVKLLF